ncbi:MAG: patatin-like phospholipase family protein, partial [Pseudomonadota bacterium]|nr:patatin-like phospholipase family protein [Pseudomonadota bacterium]
MLGDIERPRIGLALGAGAARGWAHIGVMRALIEAGIEPDIVVGTSIGAVAGGCYAAGRLGALEDFARNLTRRRVLGFLDVGFGGPGLISGRRLCSEIDRHLGTTRIESLECRFAAVATEIDSGNEVWLTS